MKFFYHFYAKWQQSPGVFGHADGTYKVESPIECPDSYARLKKIIADENGIDPKILTICSLTLLYTAI